MTVKLYDNDSYLKECRATVLSCEKKDSTTFELILDQTVFFPEEGGQTPDKGTINGYEVVDVQIKDQAIIHTIFCKDSTDPFKKDDSVMCRIDWEHRFSNMQQHTGEHIFSGFVYEKFGYDNVGFHLSDSIVTMDYNGPISMEEVMELEEKCNKAIFEGKKVSACYPSDSELQALNYRSKKELSGPIRIVTIEDVDVCACCAPHVNNISEVGILKVLDVTNYKGGVRLSILCGMRAFLYFRTCIQRSKEISHITSKPEDEIVSAVEAQKATIGLLQQQIFSLQKDALKEKVAAISPDAKNVVLFTKNTDTNILRYQVNELTESHPGYCGIFNSTENGYNFIIGSKEKDCNDLAVVLRQKFDAKCGGKAKMIQGSLVAPEEEIKELFP